MVDNGYRTRNLYSSINIVWPSMILRTHTPIRMYVLEEYFGELCNKYNT